MIIRYPLFLLKLHLACILLGSGEALFVSVRNNAPRTKRVHFQKHFTIIIHIYNIIQLDFTFSL